VSEPSEMKQNLVD